MIAACIVRERVEIANSLEPDLVLLAGDYVSRHPRYIKPGLRPGKAQGPDRPLAVLGNHDHWEGGPAVRHAVAEAGISLTDNMGFWLDRQGDRLRICGVGDLDRPAVLSRAGRCHDARCCDHAFPQSGRCETIRDRRVGLILSGHTHGGQVVMPGFGAPIVPSRYGQKYLHGLVQGPSCQVFITRGPGTVGLPVRFLCRPEIVQITLI